MSNILNLKTGEPFDPLPRLHHRPESPLAVSSSEHSARARGMLLAAKSFYIGGAAKWTNPYATDGLVAMWDGEWNAGGGVHDASATSWLDLSGNGNEISMTSCSWDEKSCVFNGAAKGVIRDSLPSDADGFELVLKSNKANQYYFMRVNNFFVALYNRLCSWKVGSTEYNYNFSARTTAFALYSKGTDFALVNGDECVRGGTVGWGALPSNQIGGNGLNNAWSFVGSVFALRFYKGYSHEIAGRNYAVDKARFNLP